MSQDKEYFAFISYQRKDEEWADWLRSKLEHYRLPSSVRKQDASLPKEIRPIFRDALELAGGVLAKEIETALQNSKFLIVICSPNSAKSPWVNKEIQTFIDLGCEDHIIPFIIDGTPFSDNEETECFPPALRSLKGEKELLGININELGRDAAYIKVVARMFGRKFDTLWQRYEREMKQQRKKKMGTFFAAISLIAIVSAIFAIKMSNKNRQLEAANIIIRNEKERADAANITLQSAYDSLSRQNEVIQQQKSDLDLSNRELHLSNLQLSQEKQNVLEQYAKLMAARAEELMNNNDYLTARRLLLDVLPPNERSLYIPEVERALRRSFNRSNCVINAHVSRIQGALISPDRKHVVSWANGEDVKIWNTETGQLYYAIPNNDSSIKVLFSPNGKLFVQSHDSIRVWEICPLRKITSFKSTSISDIDSQERILSINGNNVVITDGNTGHLLSTFAIKRGQRTGPSAIFLPGNRIACASNDSIQIWNTTTKSLIRGWKAHTRGVKFIHSSNDGQFLISDEFGISISIIGVSEAVISHDSLTVWDSYTGNVIHKYSYTVNDAIFSPDGHRIIATKNENVIIIDAESGNIVNTLKGHNADITKIASDREGHLFVSASSDGNIRLWDNPFAIPEQPSGSYSSQPICPCAFTPMGDMFLISTGNISDGHSIMAFSTNNPRIPIKIFGKKDSNGYYSLRFNKNGERFITAATVAELWSIHNFSKICVIRAKSPKYAEISPDDKMALTVQNKNAVCFWDISKGDSIVSECRVGFRSGNRGNTVKMASFSPDRRHVVTANTDGIIRIWDIRSQTFSDSLIGHTGSINSASYSPDGNHIVSASSDRTIRIWNVRDHSFTTLSGHSREVSFAEFSSDGKYVISTSFDNTCKIWNVATDQEIVSEFADNQWATINLNAGMFLTWINPNEFRLNPFQSYQNLIDKTRKLFKNSKDGKGTGH